MRDMNILRKQHKPEQMFRQNDININVINNTEFGKDMARLNVLTMNIQGKKNDLNI